MGVGGACKRQVEVLQLLLDVELVEGVIDRVVWFFGDCQEGIVGVLQARLLFLLLLEQFLELSGPTLTSSFSDFSGRRRMI